MTNFVDDFLCVGRGHVPDGLLKSVVLSMLESIGCMTGKHQHGVSVVFIGVGFDTQKSIMFIPDRKAEKALAKIRAVSSSGLIPEAVFDSLLGTLSHLCTVLIHARRWLWVMFAAQRSTRRRVAGFIEVSGHVSTVLARFVGVLQTQNARSFIPLDRWSIPTLHIYTDASRHLCGGFCAETGSWVRFEFPAWLENSSVSSNLREALAVMIVLVSMATLFVGHLVIVHCDNLHAVVVSSKRGSHFAVYNAILAVMEMAAIKERFFFVLRHIEGKLNVVADRISRIMSIELMLRLCPTLKERVQAIFTPPGALHALLWTDSSAVAGAWSQWRAFVARMKLSRRGLI